MNELQVIEKNNERVLLTSQIAESYGTTAKVITDNFSNNKGRYIEGKHFYCLEGDELREFKNKTENFGVAKNVNKLYLWTQKGALLHAKSLGTDKAWEVYDYLVDSYFQKVEKATLDMKSALLNPDTIIQLATALKEEQSKSLQLETTVKVQSQQIAELQPKASYYDVILNCKDLVSATQIAKDYGKSAKWLNEFLHNQGVQFKQGGIWILYQNYASQGYTNTKTHEYNGNDGSVHAKVHTYWTQKGRLFIYDLLKEHGYLPNCERENVA